MTLDFLSNLPQVRDLLQTDTEAAFQGDPAALSKEEIIVAYPFIEAIAVQRLAHELYLQKIPFIPRIMTEWAHGRTGIDLHPGAQIGSHFFIDHGTGTVIGETAEIGKHVKLYQGVGLVARSLAGGQSLRGQKRHPTLEDRRDHLCQRHHRWRRNSDRRREHHRRECFSDSKRPPKFPGHLRENRHQSDEQDRQGLKANFEI